MIQNLGALEPGNYGVDFNNEQEFQQYLQSESLNVISYIGCDIYRRFADRVISITRNPDSLNNTSIHIEVYRLLMSLLEKYGPIICSLYRLGTRHAHVITGVEYHSRLPTQLAQRSEENDRDCQSGYWVHVNNPDVNMNTLSSVPNIEDRDGVGGIKELIPVKSILASLCHIYDEDTIPRGGRKLMHRRQPIPLIFNPKNRTGK